MFRPAAFAVGLSLLAAAAHAAPPVPRTFDGKPDFNGVWSNSSITSLNRPASTPKLVVTEAEAAAIAKGNPRVRQAENDAKPSNLNDNLLGDRNTDAGYNAFWLDPGMTLPKSTASTAPPGSSSRPTARCRSPT